MFLIKKLAILSTILLGLVSVPAFAAFPDDLNDVVFIEEGNAPGITNYVRTMAVTASHSVNISGDNVILTNTKTLVWPLFGLADINANAWLFVKIGDTWYAGTWEFLRRGQTAKKVVALNGHGHLRFPPLHNFLPRVGETYGFMVSGVARNGIRPGRNNVHERSNVAFYKWGFGPISYEEAFPPEPVEPEEPDVHISPILDLLSDEAEPAG